uniref:Uncharacterized protein n=1 Tax=Otus sunia TaxID=257818 RepID=A0A8C8B4D9_9STRI
TILRDYEIRNTIYAERNNSNSYLIVYRCQQSKRLFHAKQGALPEHFFREEKLPSRSPAPGLHPPPLVSLLGWPLRTSSPLPAACRWTAWNGGCCFAHEQHQPETPYLQLSCKPTMVHLLPWTTSSPYPGLPPPVQCQHLWTRTQHCNLQGVWHPLRDQLSAAGSMAG